MASSNQNDICCFCLMELVKGSEHKEAYTNLNDHNVDVIERFANAWKEQGSQRYNNCINVCQKYKEQKCEASFHVKCYKLLLSNSTYLDECKKKAQATVEENKNEETSAAGHSIRNSTTTSSSSETSEKASGGDCLEKAGSLLRERILKLPNGIFKDYTDDPMVYTFFSTLCGGDDMRSENEELDKKIVFLCQEFATAVHKHHNKESSTAMEEDLTYLGHLVMNAVLSETD